MAIASITDDGGDDVYAFDAAGASRVISVVRRAERQPSRTVPRRGQSSAPQSRVLVRAILSGDLEPGGEAQATLAIGGQVITVNDWLMSDEDDLLSEGTKVICMLDRADGKYYAIAASCPPDA